MSLALHMLMAVIGPTLVLGCAGPGLSAAECAGLDADWRDNKVAFELAQSVLEVPHDLQERDDAMATRKHASDEMRRLLEAQDRGGCFD
jgi:hypothetical protein